MGKKLLTFLIVVLSVLSLSITTQAQWDQWEVDVEEDPFTGEKEIIIAKIAEDGVHCIGIRNLFQPIDLIVLVDENKGMVDFSETRYKFDDEETRTARWFSSEEISFYYFLGDTEEIDFGADEEMVYDNIRSFIRKMMEHDELTVEVEYAISKNEYVVFDLTGLKEVIEPHMDELGL